MRSPSATHSVLGFQYESDAIRFQTELRERLLKFGLELHPEKTRLIEFGRYAAGRREGYTQKSESLAMNSKNACITLSMKWVNGLKLYSQGTTVIMECLETVRQWVTLDT